MVQYSNSAWVRRKPGHDVVKADSMAGRLYVVSTPIGNLDDITLRAISTLKSVGLIAAEDTRRTVLLLRHFGISTPTTSLHEHNEQEKIPQLLKKLADGTDIAVVSDAGTPLVADPGQRLVARAAQEGISVVPIPGASAVLAALAVAGYPADEFVFVGFAPSKSKDRKQWIGALAQESRTIVLLEAPHRIEKTLVDIAEILGDRPITVGRELTKLHEQIVRTTARMVTEAKIPPKGEFTIVIGPLDVTPQTSGTVDDETLTSYFYQMTNSGAFSRRQAIAAAANKFGLSTNDVYGRLERLKATGPSS